MNEVVIDETIQAAVAEARHTPPTEKHFDAIGDSVVYTAAWWWAYEAARIAYEAGREDMRNEAGL